MHAQALIRRNAMRAQSAPVRSHAHTQIRNRVCGDTPFSECMRSPSLASYTSTRTPTATMSCVPSAGRAGRKQAASAHAHIQIRQPTDNERPPGPSLPSTARTWAKAHIPYSALVSITLRLWGDRGGQGMRKQTRPPRDVAARMSPIPSSGPPYAKQQYEGVHAGGRGHRGPDGHTATPMTAATVTETAIRIRPRCERQPSPAPRPRSHITHSNDSATHT